MAAASDRRAMIAKVHIAKKALGLDDVPYRAIIERIAGKSSSADCTDYQLGALLTEFRRLGWEGSAATHAVSKKSWVRKIRAIWGELRPLLDNADDDTLRVFVGRQTRSLKNPAGIADPEWLDPTEAAKVIHGLEGWLGRVKAKQQEAAHA